MMRRGFWLAAGVVLGVSGYRKATRLGREITGGPAASRGSQLRNVASFARDVRAGMSDYRDLHGGQSGRSLGGEGRRSLSGASQRGRLEP